MSFANNLREIRQQRKITQRDLAAMIGVSANSISNYENNVSFPDEDILRKLFVALNCEPNNLFIDKKEKLASPETSKLSKDQHDLLDLVSNLDEKSVPVIMDLIETAKKLNKG